MKFSPHSWWNSTGRLSKAAIICASLSASCVGFADEAVAQTTTFTTQSVPDTWTAVYSDADGRTITVTMLPQDGQCAAINAAGYIGSYARTSVAACDGTTRITFVTSGFLIQSIGFNDIDDMDGTGPRDGVAMNVAGTWTSPTIEVHSFASPPAFANQAARLTAAGGIGTFIANAAGDNPVNETATFTMAAPTTTFTMLHDDVQDGRDALFYFDLNGMTITTTSGNILTLNDNGTIASNTGGTNVLNVFDGDTVNGVTAAPINTDVSLASGSTLPAGLTFATGSGEVSVAAGTPVGQYSFDYEICEVGFPANCETGTATVTVTGDVDLSITKTNTPGVNGEIDQAADTVLAGSSTSYTVVVTNGGPNPVNGAVVTDTPGAGITCDAATPITLTGNGVPAGSFTFADLSGAGITLGTLLNGQSTTLTYSCQVN